MTDSILCSRSLVLKYSLSGMCEIDEGITRCGYKSLNQCSRHLYSSTRLHFLWSRVYDSHEYDCRTCHPNDHPGNHQVGVDDPPNCSATPVSESSDTLIPNDSRARSSPDSCDGFDKNHIQISPPPFIEKRYPDQPANLLVIPRPESFLKIFPESSNVVEGFVILRALQPLSCLRRAFGPLHPVLTYDSRSDYISILFGVTIHVDGVYNIRSPAALWRFIQEPTFWMRLLRLPVSRDCWLRKRASCRVSGHPPQLASKVSAKVPITNANRRFIISMRL